MPADPEPFTGEGWTGEEVQRAAPQVIYGTVDGRPFQWRIRHGREEFRVAAEAGGDPRAVGGGDPTSGAFYAESYWPGEPSSLDRTQTEGALTRAVESYRGRRGGRG